MEEETKVEETAAAEVAPEVTETSPATPGDAGAVEGGETPAAPVEATELAAPTE